jgi:xanthine/CO dehydrogenase XdhC/CoxF family maturation factor
MTHAELTALLHAGRAARRDRPAVPLALATLVAVAGSSYRQPGARLLCDADGRVLAGAISGGCLEGDVAERAGAVCATGDPVLLRYDLREDLETIWGFGTGCDGVAHVLLAPLPSLEVLEAAAAHAAARRHGALLTTLDGDGAGVTRFLADGAHDARGAAELGAFDTVLRTGAPRLEASTPRTFVAPVPPPPHLVVIGATRGAEAMVRIARAVGFDVTLVDHREAALAALALPEDVETRVIAPEHADEAYRDGGALPGDARVAIALCTHRFEHDAAWLRAALATQAPYVGVLGSRQRAARLLGLNDVTSPRLLARVYAPIGLDVGGESPDEIALAAVAEAQAVLQGRPGGSLRERRAPLHTRTQTPVVDSPALDAISAAGACAIDSSRGDHA